MNEKKFLLHYFLILKLASNPQKRIIINNNSFTPKQKELINAICKKSKNIIGQIRMEPDIVGSINEIKEIIESHSEAEFMPHQLQYHIL